MFVCYKDDLPFLGFISTPVRVVIVDNHRFGVDMIVDGGDRVY